ncbi:hypothetical protein ASF24_12715 [Methylobacterium sp. Leaf86]|nr:hypothetical protein ASF24_12715 [Methylobacterium sp. Leaf86]
MRSALAAFAILSAAAFGARRVLGLPDRPHVRRQLRHPCNRFHGFRRWRRRRRRRNLSFGDINIQTQGSSGGAAKDQAN